MSISRNSMGLMFLKSLNAALGVILTLSVARVLGASQAVDGLFIALFVAVLLPRELTQVTRIALVPCLVGKEGRETRFVNAYGVFTVASSFAAFVLVCAVAGPVVRILCPGFSPESVEATRTLILVASPCVCLYGLIGSIQGFMHARDRFFLPETAEGLWKLVALGVLLTWGARYGVPAYAIGVSVATFLQLLILVAACKRSNIRVFPNQWRVNMRLLKPFFIGALVVFLSMMLRKGEESIDRAVLSFMQPGAVAIFTYADRLAFLIPALLASSILTPALPQMARMAHRPAALTDFVGSVSILMLFFGLLLAMVIFRVAADIVSIVAAGGRFDAWSVEQAVAALKMLSLGIPATFCSWIVRGLFMIRRDLALITRCGIIAIVVRLGADLLLRDHGVAGIALARTITLWTTAGYLWYRLGNPGKPGIPLQRLCASVIAVGAALYIPPWDTLPGPVLRITLPSGAALAAAALVLFPVLPEMNRLLGSRGTAGSKP